MASPAHRGSQPRRRPRPTLVTIVAFLAALAIYTAFRAVRAADAGNEGKRSLLAAEDLLSARDLDGARRALDDAGASFAQAMSEVDGLGPIVWVLRVTPFVRVQMRAVETFAEAGGLLTESAQRLTVAADRLLAPDQEDLPFSRALSSLRDIHGAVAEGRFVLDEAAAKVSPLADVRLIGPLASARDDLLVRLPVAQDRARALDEGLAALIAFAGGSGDRRYLVFSQNPDEVRPTGGFIGTYGVIRAGGGEVDLERYAGISGWSNAHPDTVIPPEQAPTAFRLPERPQPQRLGNVNAVADWRAASSLAMDMWRRGGEEPVDGVLSVTPELLARVLEVLGAVEVPSFGERITAANLVERLDFHTHREVELPEEEEKRFIVDLSRVVLDRLLQAPASSWPRLAEEVGTGFDVREAMAWTSDATINRALADRRWDGTLPVTHGDFFYNAEFEYAAKNGRGLRRSFDHHVELDEDGSARITTNVTIANTEAFDPRFNIDSLSYITLSGPEGAALGEGGDPPTALEEALANHPAAGWDRGADPMGSVSFTVVWEAPRVSLARRDGSREYQLWWMGVPAHTGDVINLRIDLPEGWRWRDRPPPLRVELVDEFRGRWVLERSR